MIRKQVYLGREQDRKLKALAARRGCTEAAIIREALDRLPDPDRSVEAQLAAAGLLVPKRDDPDAPHGAAATGSKPRSKPGWPRARPVSDPLKPAWRIAPAADGGDLFRYLGTRAALLPV